ncbi:hypothetical protein [Thermocrinis sp.]
MEGLFGASYLYYAISEALLTGDLYHMYKVCQNLVESDYSKEALEVLKFIYSRRLEAELSLLPQEVFLERSYRELNESRKTYVDLLAPNKKRCEKD